MSDLIRRQDAIDAALTFLVEYCGAAFDEDMQKMLCERLDALPSVEPEEEMKAEPERKKGKWQRRKDEDCWECSECHAVLENSDIGNHNFYYCYHCCADMMDICGYMDLEKANYE